ncbi:hypothetical protein HLB44_21000 [Aquincola sp. S2]|uniref:ATPase with chaperone activity n=1 Tax=Pseudaquabacterium terrae TaxID=2732868 RepID=A0ABX2ELF1_9BURK|nr:hypothetical protein [Aquabacterium terrae]NRF69484.1 hypothetical protein [Aquabacterium terrae]
MSDDYQIPIPPSFHALHSDPRGRLTLPLAEFRTRYELCEDMAQQLVERAQAAHHDIGLAEDEVLARCHAGVGEPEVGLSADEAAWVTLRLAELLGWPFPDWLPPPTAAGRPSPPR